MSEQLNLLDSLNVTFLPELPAGASLFSGQDGPPIKPFGRDHAPAKGTVTPAKDLARKTSVTCGLYGLPSSASVSLQSSLESKLRQRFDMVGSIVYAQTWKRRTTPSGASWQEHTASVPRTGGKGCTGWPSPKTPTGGANSKRDERGSGGADLREAALLTGWTTPQAHDVTGRSQNQKEIHGTKHGCACLAREADITGWATPAHRDFHSEEATDEYNQKRWEHSRGKPLSAEVTLAAWNTPHTPIEHDSENSRSSYIDKQISGPDTPSSPAETEKRGSLNPALPRWLMGFPVEWCQAAIRANRAMPTRRRKPA